MAGSLAPGDPLHPDNSVTPGKPTEPRHAVQPDSRMEPGDPAGTAARLRARVAAATSHLRTSADRRPAAGAATVPAGRSLPEAVPVGIDEMRRA